MRSSLNIPLAAPLSSKPRTHTGFVAEGFSGFPWEDMAHLKKEKPAV
jgi:hypothetical protein